VECVKLLLNAGADPCLLDDNGGTPLVGAITPVSPFHPLVDPLSAPHAVHCHSIVSRRR
jgi:hypothetical protein